MSRLLLLLVAAVSFAQVEDAKPDQKTEAPLRVLFLGNSYTYYNSLPDMVSALAASTPGRKIEAKSVTRGGATLADLWSLTNALETLRSGTWDVVILQDQSTLGMNFVDGRWYVNEPAGLNRWARYWNAEIQRKNAKVVFYLTWGRKAHPEFQTHLNYAYSEVARELNGGLAPVGLAWKRIRETTSQIELFDADGTHPSPAGTYLNACVFLETLVGRTCEGATRKVPAITLDEVTQKTLSDAAHYAMEQLRAGYLTGLPKPDYGTLKPLTPPAGLKANDFNGVWKGLANIYNGTHEMEVKISGDAKTCKGYLMLFNRRTATRLEYPLENCRIDMGTLLFQTADPRLVVDSYKAIIVDGKLTGTQSTDTVNPYTRFLGSFELRREVEK